MIIVDHFHDYELFWDWDGFYPEKNCNLMLLGPWHGMTLGIPIILLIQKIFGVI